MEVHYYYTEFSVCVFYTSIEGASQAALPLNQRGLGAELKLGGVTVVPQKFL